MRLATLAANNVRRLPLANLDVNPLTAPVFVGDSTTIIESILLSDPCAIPVVVGDVTTTEVSVALLSADSVAVPVSVIDAQTTVSVTLLGDIVNPPATVVDAISGVPDTLLADTLAVPVTVIDAISVETSAALPTTLLGTSGMTTITSEFWIDEVMSTVSLPFNVPIYGTSYSTLYVSSNGWIGVTNSQQYSAFSTSSPSFRNIQISSTDGNVRFVYGREDSAGSLYRIRFEGNSYYGAGSTDKIYEVTFASDGQIAIVTGTLGTQSSAERISKGDGSKFTNLTIDENKYIHLAYNAGTDNYDVTASN